MIIQKKVANNPLGYGDFHALPCLRRKATFYKLLRHSENIISRTTNVLTNLFWIVQYLLLPFFSLSCENGLADIQSQTLRGNETNLHLLILPCLTFRYFPVWTCAICTVLSLINAPPLINAPLTYFQIKLGKIPKFLYGVSL